MKTLFGIRRHAAAAALTTVMACGGALAAGSPAGSAPGSGAGVTAAEALGLDALRGLAMGETTVVRGVPVDSRSLDLELERFDVWAGDGVFMIDGNELSRPNITLLRGRVAGEADSQVVIGIGDHATNGFVRSGGNTYSISTGGQAEADALRIANLAGFAFDADRPGCGLTDATLDALNPTGVPVHHIAERVMNGNAPRGTAPCRVARIAIDSDWEWTQEVFGGNANASAEYALFLLAGISEVYQRDVNVRLVCSFLRTWSNNSDPYTGNTSPDPLDQVRDHWNANMGHIDREVTHLLTGADTSYGGVAYLSVICNGQYGYGVSSYMDGSFPYPLQQNSYSNWDLVVMAHELGHNFGTLHTHDGYDPPLDRCGIDCSGNLNGTIMSYCHICSGGLINVDLRFHPTVQGVIENYLQFDAPCNLQPANAANDDFADTAAGMPVDIFVLTNDAGADCAPVGIASVQSPTPGGAAVSIEGWDNPTGDPTGHWLRYTPAAGQSNVTDSFTYTTTGGQTATVSVDIAGLRPDDEPANAVAGLGASYYEISQFTGNVPDFNGLTPFEQGVSDELNYPSTSGPAVGGTRSDYVAALFEGYVEVPADGVYTFSLESDDGSILWVGDEEVVNNDGLHGMQTQSGSIGLEAGYHEIRVGFFEAGGGAGLIFRWNGPGVTGVVPSSALSREATDCGVADLAEPYGVLDLADVTTFALGFQIQDPATDLAAPFGVWDLADIAGFVSAFNAGCQ